MLHQERVIISIRTEIAVKFLCFSVGRLVVAVSGKENAILLYIQLSLSVGSEGVTALIP